MKLTFAQFVRHLERRLGHHQLPLNPSATGIQDLFESCALHHELMMRLVQEIYKKNKCEKLSDTVTRSATFDAVAPIRLEILRGPHTDIDLYNLMEDLCAAINAAFGGDPTRPQSKKTPIPSHGVAQDTQRVVELSRFRRRKINSLV
jgi:hypothetical protein